MDTIKEFHLVRINDETGISGTGVVARGVVLPSGAVVLEWQTFHSSICIYKNLGDVDAIHGHQGKTLLIMGPPPARSLHPILMHKRNSKTTTAYCGIPVNTGEPIYYEWKDINCKECLKHKKK